jgi:hypothetical protein
MSVVVRNAWLVALATLGLVLAVLIFGGKSSSPAPIITTDTQAYCQRLGQRVTELAPVAVGPGRQQAVSLAGEGRSLCARGEIRGGILRLRQAMKLMMDASVRPH